MTLIVLCIITFSLFSAANGQTYYGSADLTTFRDGRDKEFRDKVESPLKEEDLAGFKGLNYYVVNKAFRVTATFARTADEKYFEMPTSSGRTKKFVKYGILTFRLGGKTRKLSVYQIDKEVLGKFPEYADLLFVPFKDLTARTETYGGGRYIDIKLPKGSKVTLDFNLAYNPNCAYGGDKWNCPIPPRENTLQVSITAGEKRYMYSGYKPH
jgi:uncharacterized protein (DUF1684 family)